MPWRIKVASLHVEGNHHGEEPVSLVGLGTAQVCWHRTEVQNCICLHHSHHAQQVSYAQQINCCIPSMLSSFLPSNTVPSAYNGPPPLPWQIPSHPLIPSYMSSSSFFYQVIMLISIANYELCEDGQRKVTE